MFKFKRSKEKSDDETIALLLKHGADLDTEYVIDFFFTGNNENLKRTEEVLLGQGYKKPTQSKKSELLMQQLIKLDLMKNHFITESLESIAHENGVSFDGWGTVAN